MTYADNFRKYQNMINLNNDYSLTGKIQFSKEALQFYHMY